MSENIKIVEIIAPLDGETAMLHTPKQRAFFSDPSRLIPHEADPKPNESDNTSPMPVRFRWKAPGRAILRVSLNPDLSDCMEYSGINDYRLYNLLPGRKYYFQLQCGDAFSEIRSFATAMELPRVIHWPDMTNIRDCGGWQLANGKRYKFNMLFRGAQFEPWTVLMHGCGINAEGKRLLEELKIRTELDLRLDGENFYASESMNYCKIPSTAYATWQEHGVFAPEAMENMRKIFELLADEQVYPVFFHCQGGGDRTGTLAFLLGAVLGMSYDDLITDYEFSNLSVSGERIRYSTVWTRFEERLKTFAPGGSVQQQAENYLRQCGVTDIVLEKIRANLTE